MRSEAVCQGRRDSTGPARRALLHTDILLRLNELAVEEVYQRLTSVRASEDGERVMVISVHGGGLSGPPPDEAARLCEAT